jgi:hypothetical protein
MRPIHLKPEKQAREPMTSTNHQNPNRRTAAQIIDRGVLFLLCGLLLLVAEATNLIFASKYEQYRYLAEAFLAGQLDFLEIPGTSWDDTAPYDGKFYWPLGLFPAVFLAPFVLIWRFFGATFQQGYIVFPLLMGSFYLIFRIARKLGKSSDQAVWIAVAFVGSTSYIAIALVPWSWHLAHIVAVWLLLIAIDEILGRRRWALIGLVLGLLFATRPTAGLSVICFAGLLAFGDDPLPKKLFHAARFGSCLAAVLFVVLYYNYLRYGSPFESGYNYQLGWKPDGRLIGPWNIIPNLRVFLFGVPVGTDQFPFFAANPFGMSIFVVSPWLLLARPMRWNWQDSLFAANIVLIIWSFSSWWSTGSNQMGYRFSLDFMPLLFWLLLRTNATRVTPAFKVSVVLSVLANLYFLTTVFRG